MPSLRSVAATAVLIIALCWPAIMNGQPFFLLDTIYYLNSAGRGAEKLIGMRTSWYPPKRVLTAPDQPSETTTAASPAQTPSAAVQTPSSERPKSAVLISRSVYYGLFLLISDSLHGLWLAVLAQAALIAACAYLTLRKLFKEPSSATLVSLIAVAIFTPLPFFVTYLMPDILAAVTILACANLFIAGSRLRPWELVFWYLCLAFALLSHSSHVLLAAALIACFTAFQLLSNSARQWRGVLVAAAALATAFFGEAAFSFAVEKMTGAPPFRPPFLMARIAEDGPGYRYLRATCPGNGLAVCAFVDRLPLDHEQFMWTDPGLFAIADPEMRRKLSAEQVRYALNVLRYDPLGQSAVSLASWVRQFWTIDLNGFNLNQYVREGFVNQLPDTYLSRMKHTLAFNEAIPITLANYFHLLAVLAAIAYLSWSVPRRWQQLPSLELMFWTFTGVVILGEVINAGICGVLSGLHGRYQARVIWLIPWMAALHILLFRHSWLAALQSVSAKWARSAALLVSPSKR